MVEKKWYERRVLNGTVGSGKVWSKSGKAQRKVQKRIMGDVWGHDREGDVDRDEESLGEDSWWKARGER